MQPWVLPTKSSLHPKLSVFPGVSRLTVGFVDASRVGLQIPLGLGCNDCDPFHTLLIDYDRLCRRDIFFQAFISLFAGLWFLGLGRAELFLLLDKP